MKKIQTILIYRLLKL